MSDLEGRNRLSARFVALATLSVVAVLFVCAFVFYVFTTPDWNVEEIRGLELWTNGVHDMAVDSEGNPNVACLGVDGGFYSLEFAKKVNGTWTVTPLVTVSGDSSDVSIALDSRDRVYICTTDKIEPDLDFWQIIFATDRNGSWSVEKIPVEFRPGSSAIAVDSQDRVYIISVLNDYVFWNGEYWPKAHLLHYSEMPWGWENDEIFPPVENLTLHIESIKIGQGDTMHILLRNSVRVDEMGKNEYSLSHASNTSGEWIQEDLTSHFSGGPDAWYLFDTYSMAIDSNNRAHLCGYSWDNDSLVYEIAYTDNVDGLWSWSNLSYAGNCWPTSSSMAIDSKGAIHIAYYAQYYPADESQDPYNITERYLTNRSGSWKQEIVDSERGSSFSDRIRVAIGLDDKVHLTYFCDLGVEGGGSHYYVRHLTQLDEAEELGDSAIAAAKVTFAAAPLVAIGVIVYSRAMRKRSLAPGREQ